MNAPNRETCTVRRERTNTPLQALVTLNDPQLIEAARHLAQTAIRDGGATFETKVDLIAKRLLARSLRPTEMKIVKETFDELLADYKANAAEVWG